MRAEAVALLVLIILIPVSSAFNISPTNPKAGDKITITGTAAPGEQVNFRSSFSMDLPVSNGQYEYETNVEIPQKPNKLAVTARNVLDMNLGVKMIIWITKRFEASGGTASISQSDVPPGRYDLKMFGAAADGASSVAVSVNAETAVMADSSGKYSLAIDTSGIPNGDYSIEGGGESKVIRFGGTASSAASPPTSSEGLGGHEDSGGTASSSALPHINQNTPGLEITPDIISWYAGNHSLDSKNATQYAEADRQLKALTSGGYWKVISRGDPLTEHAGSCEDKYCLVRGKDACTNCRYEEMAGESFKASQKINTTEIKENISESSTLATAADNSTTAVNATISKNTSSSRSAVGEKGFFSRIINWFLSVIGG